MNTKTISNLRNAIAAGKPSYYVTLTDSGKWMHAPGSDFLFAFLDPTWEADVVKQVTASFEAALKMSTIVKKAVKDTSGQDVVNGLYLLDQVSMTKAMNSIEGMGMTSADQENESGSGTAASINGQFFSAILGGLTGDVAPMMAYLTTQMGDIQAETAKSTVTKTFGTIVGMVSLMPVLNVPITTFQYVFSSSTVSDWFVSINCASVEEYSYNYAYTVVNYNYDPSK